MADYTQADRPFRVDSELGEDVLLLEGFSGEEGISSPFCFTVDMLSEDPEIDPQSLVRKPVTLTVQLAGGDERFVHGLVRRFVQLGQSESGALTSYQAEVVPWLWFLSLSRDCKIFQGMDVLEIVEDVFKTQGFSDFEIKCVKDYPKREFCVQYRETHLDFVSRLLEQEGIFYFFQHSDSQHILTLADDPGEVKPCPAESTARMSPMPEAAKEEDFVTALRREHAAFLGTVTLGDYDYLQAQVLEGSYSGDGEQEVFDYAGDWDRAERDTKLSRDELERLARLRLEEQEAWRDVVRGAGTCRTFQSGYSFDLTEHYRDDVNQTYQLLHVRHSAKAGSFKAGKKASFEYRNEFVAIPAGVPFRPPLTTPKPVVHGPQTAVVVGPASGKRVFTDRGGYGRVKVQFHWDRYGANDDKSSCWIRTSQRSAGKGWGALQLPHIGNEVIVEFLEGDPDRPVITGCVYNADNVLPLGSISARIG
ncbi:MAG: type VI secretion system tip protein VgrG [Gemmatimonadota bacterium]|nr:MAG: type VI secretion system tip protein VgrG [Gemmatimonadota bacterium]